MIAERTPEHRRPLGYEEWENGISKYKDKYSELVSKGYDLFFRTVLNLPNLESQPNHYWSDYQESDIRFVRLDEEYLRRVTVLNRLRLIHIQKLIGFWPLTGMDVGIFDVRDDKSEVYKEKYRHSANVVIQSAYGETFKKKVVFHLSYRHSRLSSWSERAINYTLFGFNDDDHERLKRASELDLLLLVDNLAQIYAEEIKSQALQSPNQSLPS